MSIPVNPGADERLTWPRTLEGLEVAAVVRDMPTDPPGTDEYDTCFAVLVVDPVSPALYRVLEFQVPTDRVVVEHGQYRSLAAALAHAGVLAEWPSEAD